MPEAPVQEDGNGSERRAVVALHEISADIGLAHVELGLARHAPVPLARSHPGQHDEIEAIGVRLAPSLRARTIS